MTDLKRRDMVYAGIVEHTMGLMHAYYIIAERGDLEDRAQIYAEALGNFPPGAVCSFPFNSDGSVQAAGGMFKRMWPDDAAVSEWKARHDAMAASQAAWSSKDLVKGFERLEPIRAAYRRLPEEQQGVLIAQIVRYVVSSDDK